MSLFAATVSAELSRQRRSTQAEVALKVNALEEEVSRLREELGKNLSQVFSQVSRYNTQKLEAMGRRKVTPKCFCPLSPVPGGAVEGAQGAAADGAGEGRGPGRAAAQARQHGDGL